MTERRRATPQTGRARIAAGRRDLRPPRPADPRLAWALLAEPVDPAVEAERLHFRHSYRDVVAG